MKIYIFILLILTICLLLRQIYMFFKYPAVVGVTWKNVLTLLDKSRVMLNREKDKISFLNDHVLINYFETTTKVFENLLVNVSVSKQGIQESYESIEATAFLAKQLSDRCERLLKAIHQQVGNGRFKVDLLYTDMSIDQSANIGCYFCSRPHHPLYFSHVDVKVSEETKNVVACRVCRQELETTGEVKVLSFLKKGKASHWSETSGYKPNASYWNKKSSPKKTKSSLKLIKPTTEH